MVVGVGSSMAHRSRTPPRNVADQNKFRASDEVAYAVPVTGEAVVLRCSHAGKVKNRAIAFIGPTVLWLVHPHVTTLIGRYERFGAVKLVEGIIAASAELQARHMASHDAYVADVLAKLENDTQREFFQQQYVNCSARKYGNAAVGEPLSVKCLHAQAGAALAGLPNPSGAAIINYALHCADRLATARDVSAAAAKSNKDDGVAEDGDSNERSTIAAIPTAAPSITDDFGTDFPAFLAAEAAAGRDPWVLPSHVLSTRNIPQACLSIIMHHEGAIPKGRKKHRIN